MKRTITMTIVTAATIAAIAAVWLWGLSPLGFASYLSSIGATDANIIRQYWPHRLVEPEWISATSDRLMKWHIYETIVRLSVVGVLWFIIVGGSLSGLAKRWRLGQGAPTNHGPAHVGSFSFIQI